MAVTSFGWTYPNLSTPSRIFFSTKLTASAITDLRFKIAKRSVRLVEPIFQVST